ncbi:hypothetical protein KA005_57965, partial [bacterium]|nr:hypothetical protein [bacterium]
FLSSLPNEISSVFFFFSINFYLSLFQAAAGKAPEPGLNSNSKRGYCWRGHPFFAAFIISIF